MVDGGEALHFGLILSLTLSPQKLIYTARTRELFSTLERTLYTYGNREIPTW